MSNEVENRSKRMMNIFENAFEIHREVIEISIPNHIIKKDNSDLTTDEEDDDEDYESEDNE